MSLLKEFQDAFHERMCRKMQMASTDRDKCAIEKNVQAGVSTPSSGIAPLPISTECGKPGVSAGTAQSLPSWPGSMRGHSLDPGRGHPRNIKAADDVKSCGHEQAGENTPESHLHGKREQCEQPEQRPDRPVRNQGLPSNETETPNSSTDGGGAGCVRTAQCTPIGEVDRSTRSAFGLHGDIFTQAAARCQRCMAGSDPKKPSRSHVGCDCGATAVAVIQDPFSANKRRLLTVDTEQYLDWARSSTIVDDLRQETDGLDIF